MLKAIGCKLIVIRYTILIFHYLQVEEVVMQEAAGEIRVGLIMSMIHPEVHHQTETVR